MRQPFRLHLTGSRTWDDTDITEYALAAILAHHPEGVLLVHGACPHGADAIAAAAYADRTPGYHSEAHPAAWHRHGRAAGHLRNIEMVTLGADGCAAFLRGTSPGTTATIRQATAAGIPVWLHKQP
jgi:YspA, cpYpsA-related SLOG family